jgi:uncharacterized protein
MSKKVLGIVLKTVERCNIDCTYCYFFNGIDNSFETHPPYISFETVKQIASFLKQGCNELEIDEVRIGLHGGEPLMQKKYHFDEMCTYFREKLEPEVTVSYTLQTNAILINEKWIELLLKHKIGVGVSIDGPKEYHDKYRIDHRKRGTYDRVAAKIKEMMDSPLKGNIGSLGVINPEFNPRKIYRHFVDDLGFKHMNFLLQDYNYDNPSPYPASANGKFLCALFDEWVKDDNPDITVVHFKSTIDLFKGGLSAVYGIGPTSVDILPLITIASNGDLSPVDELRNTNKNIMNTANVSSITLAEFINTKWFQVLREAFTKRPRECQQCCWENVCGGGGIINRYSTHNGFDNPSIYCEGLQDYYSEVASYMLKNGFPVEKLNQQLFSIAT